MSWKEVTPDTANRKPDVKFAVGGRTGNLKARLTLSSELTKRLGWNERSSLRLYVGFAEHDQKIRLVGDSGGPLSLAGGPRGSAAIALGRFPGLVLEACPATGCAHVLDDKALVVTLPLGTLEPPGTVDARGHIQSGPATAETASPFSLTTDAPARAKPTAGKVASAGGRTIGVARR